MLACQFHQLQTITSRQKLPIFFFLAPRKIANRLKSSVIQIHIQYEFGPANMSIHIIQRLTISHEFAPRPVMNRKKKSVLVIETSLNLLAIVDHFFFLHAAIVERYSVNSVHYWFQALVKKEKWH